MYHLRVCPRMVESHSMFGSPRIGRAMSQLALMACEAGLSALGLFQTHEAPWEALAPAPTLGKGARTNCHQMEAVAVHARAR